MGCYSKAFQIFADKIFGNGCCKMLDIFMPFTWNRNGYKWKCSVDCSITNTSNHN